MKLENLTTYDRLIYHIKTRKDKAGVTSEVASALQSARKFVISNNASAKILEAMANYPEFIGMNSEFAIPPFPNTWIEFDVPSMNHHEKLSPQMMEGHDTRIGYFYCNGTVHAFSEANDRMPIVLPIVYHLNKSMTHEEEIRFAELLGTSRIGIDPFLWGHNIHRDLSDDMKRSLRIQHSMSIGKSYVKEDSKNKEILKNLIKSMYFAGAGELRNIIAVLLMLNQPGQTIVKTEVPRQRGLIKGKSQPYFGYSQIDINLDRRSPKRIFDMPKGAKRSFRWHEVRGHFCHNPATRLTSCIHEWEQLEPKKWECSKGCGAKRVWRELPNGRGDASKGFVHQTRAIKTDKDKGMRHA